MAAALGVTDFAAAFFSTTAGFSSPNSSSPVVCSVSLISIPAFSSISYHFTIFFISLAYTLSKSISAYTFSKYAFIALLSAFASGFASLLTFIAKKTSTKFTLSSFVKISILSKCEKL